jgi:hypothetical protein
MMILTLVTLGLQIQAQDKKDTKEIVGKVKSVDIEKQDFIITLSDGKERKFHVTKDTKFVGPKGGVSDEGLKDDRMAKGYEVKVVAAGDNKTAREVKLPYGKKDEEKKDKK